MPDEFPPTPCEARKAAMWQALRDAVVVADKYANAVQPLAQAIYNWLQANADLDGRMAAVFDRLGYTVAPEGPPPDYLLLPTAGLGARRTAITAAFVGLEEALGDFDCSNADWENAALGWEMELAALVADAEAWNADYESVRADYEFIRNQG